MTDDTLEFVALVQPEPEQPNQRKRFGTDPRHAPLFDALKQACMPVFNDWGASGKLDRDLLGLTGRMSPIQPARRLSAKIAGAPIYLKREDFAGDDRHLMLSIGGQALMALALGRTTLLTACSDGRRGVGTAQIAAQLGLKCQVFMDPADIERNAGNAFRVRMLGATLKRTPAKGLPHGDIREAALAEWARHPQEAFLITGLDAAPAPYPTLVGQATSSIGRECRRQVHAACGGLPAAVVARNGDSADALGVFPAFLADADVQLVCTKAAELPPSARGGAGAGANVYNHNLQGLTPEQDRRARAIMQNLEYPGVQREHALLSGSGRVNYVSVRATAARDAIREFGRTEGYIPAYETAHVLAHACELARTLGPRRPVVAVVTEAARQDIWDIRRMMGDTD